MDDELKALKLLTDAMNRDEDDFEQNIKHIMFSVQILSYDKNGVKKKLIEMINAVIEKKKIKGILKHLAIHPLRLLPKQTPETIVQFAFGIKPVRKRIRHSINQFIRSKYTDDDHEMLFHVQDIRYLKVGEGMKLQIEIDEIDLDALFEKILQDVWHGQEKSIMKKFENHHYDQEKNDKKLHEKKMIYETLSSLNEGISADQKCHLIQMFLQWLSDNNVITQVVDTLIQEDEDIADVLAPLGIKVGDVLLEYDFINHKIY